MLPLQFLKARSNKTHCPLRYTIYILHRKKPPMKNIFYEEFALLMNYYVAMLTFSSHRLTWVRMTSPNIVIEAACFINFLLRQVWHSEIWTWLERCLSIGFWTDCLKSLRVQSPKSYSHTKLNIGISDLAMKAKLDESSEICSLHLSPKFVCQVRTTSKYIFIAFSSWF